MYECRSECGKKKSGNEIKNPDGLAIGLVFLSSAESLLPLAVDELPSKLNPTDILHPLLPRRTDL